MTGISVEWGLMVQLLIETGLCVLIVYYICGAKNLRREILLEKEKMKAAVDSLHQLIKKSEELDMKRHKVLERCGKREGEGTVLNNCIDRSPEDGEATDSIPNAYEQVSCLIEKGLSTNEISQKLRLPRGEVELVMNLKRQ